MIRKIIEIDEDKCDGCQECITACPEGAIQLIDGKAKLVKDFYCDGLGACIGNCPQGAITVIEREAAAYDEKATMKNIMKQGEKAVKEHLQHLHEHNELELLKEAKQVLEDDNSTNLNIAEQQSHSHCPGSRSFQIERKPQNIEKNIEVSSALTHWPIQLHLMSPHAPHYKNSNVLLTADCVPFALPNFHQKYLSEKTLAIACPKLDQEQQIYLDKIQALIDHAEIKSLSIMVMQVPCCSGLVNLVQTALQQSKRKIPVSATVVGIQGNILEVQQIN